MVTRPKKMMGFTLLELVIAVAIIGILAGISIAGGSSYLERAHIADAIVSIKTIEINIDAYAAESDAFPADLAELGLDELRDPWGNPFMYTNLQTAPPGKARKDKFLVPINSDYDLWSNGPDGASVAPLTAKTSRDDIIRANDGGFYGKASAY